LIHYKIPGTPRPMCVVRGVCDRRLCGRSWPCGIQHSIIIIIIYLSFRLLDPLDFLCNCY